MPDRNDSQPRTCIPELGTFDETAFDRNPLWATAAGVLGPPPVVLVVDDDPAIAALLHRLLRSLISDYEVIAVTNPAAALQHLTGRTVPLVITDFSMPKMSGLDLTALIKARSPQTCVLLVSAFATTALERQALHQRVDYYLPKPFQLANLEQIITMVLTSR